MNRRILLTSALALATSRAFGQVQPSDRTDAAFSREWLEGEAKRLSQENYEPNPMIPEEWRNLSYEDFQHIWFNSKNGIWMDEDRPLKLDLFTAGLFFPRAVEINTVENGMATPLLYDFSLFDKTDNFPDLPIDETIGYSGVRLRAELNKTAIFEEFMVFQGASYFRAIGNGQTYGLSARGLALRTGNPDGEEFPDFTHFYIEAAQPGDTTFMVHALLNGPSTTGAYTFRITPGTPTIVDVDAVLYPRVDLSHAGLAALTSMFLFDETNRHKFNDFRPAVHDSEGLLMLNGNNERIWRPLGNHSKVEISSFVDTNPKGFGLMQRTRDPERYADLEAHYHERPSLWITPSGEWGEGVVELVEIPADKEIYDNIVAYWRPREPIAAGSEYRFAYNMAWGDEPEALPDVAKVVNSRIGKGFDQIKTVFAIDYAPHPNFDVELDEINITLRSSTGELAPGILQRNPGTGGVRLAFSLLPGEAEAAELRAQLWRNGKIITEVWLYRWTA